LLGFAVGNFAVLGLDLYCERSIYRFNRSDVTDNVETRVTIKGNLWNPGLLASLHLRNLPLRLRLGGGTPIARHSYEQDAAGAVSEKTAASKKTYYMQGAAELDVNMFDLGWTLGADYKYSAYDGLFEDSPAGGTYSKKSFPTYSRMYPNVYVGLLNILADKGFVLAAQARAGFIFSKMEPKFVLLTVPKETNDTLKVGLNTGIEKTWDALRRLDAVFVRAGLSYTAFFGMQGSEGSYSLNSAEERIIYSAERSGFGLPVGAGIRKGVFTFDIMMSPRVLVNAFKLFNGTSTDDDFMKATITVDMGSLKKAQTESPAEHSPALKKKPVTAASESVVPVKKPSGEKSGPTDEVRDEPGEEPEE
jgi:hypothetical protein